MYYDGYHFWGMHLTWWLIWIFLLFWVFATPYNVPFQMRKRESPLDILREQLASGNIKVDEYHEKKRILENDSKK